MSMHVTKYNSKTHINTPSLKEILQSKITKHEWYDVIKYWVTIYFLVHHASMIMAQWWCTVMIAAVYQFSSVLCSLKFHNCNFLPCLSKKPH